MLVNFCQDDKAGNLRWRVEPEITDFSQFQSGESGESVFKTYAQVCQHSKNLSAFMELGMDRTVNADMPSKSLQIQRKFLEDWVAQDPYAKLLPRLVSVAICSTAYWDNRLPNLCDIVRGECDAKHYLNPKEVRDTTPRH
jgi:hypothetical protein